MTKYSKPVLSVLLWFFGGTLYFLLEVAYKLVVGHSEQISWTMLLLAIFLTVPVERCGDQLPWECPLFLQAFICAVLVTIVEFFAGVVLNIVLGMNIWDYSDLPFNLFGQVCLQFSVVWILLCLAFIPIFDWLRWTIEGGEKPRYFVCCNHRLRTW